MQVIGLKLIQYLTQVIARTINQLDLLFWISDKALYLIQYNDDTTLSTIGVSPFPQVVLTFC